MYFQKMYVYNVCIQCMYTMYNLTNFYIISGKLCTMVEFLKGVLYTCDCGYKTTIYNLAHSHSKTKKCVHHTMNKKEMRFVSEEDYVSPEQKYISREISVIDEERKNTIVKLCAENDELSATVKRQKSAMIKLMNDKQFDDDDDDCEGSGIIYFVRDTVVTDRGKIGRTKNTDVKKLKSRYSTFGSPRIQCYLSTDIKNDEAKLKARLREVGCMLSNTEMVTNCDLAISIFCEFASE